MPKKRIYLDTSVVSHLFQDDAVEKMSQTWKLWEAIKNGEFIVYISDVVEIEVNACFEPKRSKMLDALAKISYKSIIVKNNKEIEAIANKFVVDKVLPAKSVLDCLHVAAAIANDCDIIVSWNFKHLVNYKTVDGARLIAFQTGHKQIAIEAPIYLIPDKL
ncbi:MAG: PIN domain-containing protein [Bacillales bacterium]|jgi:predicted nucleic acid-binding protein|nr:PIN domain-containing protein [Bacillales bacterium]